MGPEEKGANRGKLLLENGASSFIVISFYILDTKNICCGKHKLAEWKYKHHRRLHHKRFAVSRF